jgi:hypothetical protein
MADLQLQPSISTDLRCQAHLGLIDRLKQLDLSPILVYRMASLVDSAVLAMAWQWDVLNPLLVPALQVLAEENYASWDAIQNIDALNQIDQLLFEVLTDTTPTGEALFDQYRALILLSTSLHSEMGTVGAIKNGFAGLGFPQAVLQEGQNSWGGTQYPSNQGWAVFRVLIDLSTVPVGTDLSKLSNQMTAMCNFWKPARCILDSVQFQWHLLDTLIPAPSDVTRNIFTQHDFLSPLPSDFISAPFFPISDSKVIVPFWNARYYHTGITYGQNEPQVADSALVVNGHAIAH